MKISQFLPHLSWGNKSKAQPTHQPHERLSRGSTGSSLDSTLEFLSKLERQMQGRAKQDIKTLIDAWTLARNPLKPKRARLYQVYDDVEMDDQVETVQSNMVADVISEEFYMTHPGSTEKDDAATEYFNKPWFFEFLEYGIRTEAWGHKLIEFAKPVIIDGELQFPFIEQIPKEHVIPEFGLIVAKPGDEEGISYRTHPLAPKTLIEIGKPRDLGKLLKAARPALYKKNIEGAWSKFSEIFGMPIRIGKVASRNKEDFDAMETFMKNMGQAAYAVTGTDDQVELKETTKGDAYQVFEKYMERADKAIAKIFLGQTMTVDNGSSLSQAEVHERVSKARKLAIKLSLDFVINLKLIPLMRLNGYKIKPGQKFYWAAVDEITEVDIAMDEFLAQTFEFDDLNYFSNKYGVPIKGLRALPGAAPDKVAKDVKGALSRVKQLRKEMGIDEHIENCC